MNVWEIIGLVAILGMAGGLTNCFLAGGFTSPQSDTKGKVWKPGWIENIVIGGIAAVVVWCFYGPASSYDLVKDGVIDFHLPVAQIASSILVGISGAKILTTMAQRQAERAAKIDLAKVLEDILKSKE
jgi:hypothetical protein